MSRIDDFSLELRGPKFFKKFPILVFDNHAKVAELDDVKKLWSTCESYCDEFPNMPQSKHEKIFPKFFVPGAPVSEITMCLDGRDSNVLSIKLLRLESENRAIVEKVNDIDQLRIYARRCSLFFGNYCKMKPAEYSQTINELMKWSNKNYSDYIKMKSGEI